MGEEGKEVIEQKESKKIWRLRQHLEKQ